MQRTNMKTKKSPWSRRERKIFAAFEWNDKVKGMYKSIFEKITKDGKWEKDYGYRWSVQFGAEFTYPADSNWKSDVSEKDIEEFIYQNKQLYDVFVKGISSCNLFIADITHHNPNVMIELGIAVQQNKNILVVTSQDIKDMVFDIRGLKAVKYVSKKELRQIIEKQMKIYSEIKGQTFENSFISNKKYAPNVKGLLTNKEAIHVPGTTKLKDLRIKVKFRFTYSTNNELDWFGISLRTQGPWRYFSELVLVRYSGKTRSLTWPERRKENEGETVKIVQNKWHTFEILTEENKIAAWIDNKQVVEDIDVIIEDFGEIWLACFDHHEQNGGAQNNKGNYLEVEYKNIEILDLNTTINLFGNS